MSDELRDAALAVADTLPLFDERGLCPVCRRRRDPSKYMESHRLGCTFADYLSAKDRAVEALAKQARTR